VAQFEVVFASSVEYVSLSQFAQSADPTLVLYVPAPHAEHVVPSWPVYPLLHLQSVLSSLATLDCMFAAHPTHVETETAATVVEYMFAAQFVHFAVPVVSLNLPAMQLIHGKRESMA
jgi:hypothetical protein